MRESQDCVCDPVIAPTEPHARQTVNVKRSHAFPMLGAHRFAPVHANQVEMHVRKANALRRVIPFNQGFAFHRAMHEREMSAELLRTAALQDCSVSMRGMVYGAARYATHLDSAPMGLDAAPCPMRSGYAFLKTPMS